MQLVNGGHVGRGPTLEELLAKALCHALGGKAADVVEPTFVPDSLKVQKLLTRNTQETLDIFFGSFLGLRLNRLCNGLT
jgi:hypothetical protein